MSDRPDRNEQRRARELAALHGISYQQAVHRLRAQSPTPNPNGVFASAHMGKILTLARREADLLGQGRDVVTEQVLDELDFREQLRELATTSLTRRAVA